MSSSVTCPHQKFILSLNKQLIIWRSSKSQLTLVFSSLGLLCQWHPTWLPFSHMCRTAKFILKRYPKAGKCSQFNPMLLDSVMAFNKLLSAPGFERSMLPCAVRACGEKCLCHTVMCPTGNRYHSWLHDRCGRWAVSETPAHHFADRLWWQQAICDACYLSSTNNRTCVFLC